DYVALSGTCPNVGSVGIEFNAQLFQISEVISRLAGRIKVRNWRTWVVVQKPGHQLQAVFELGDFRVGEVPAAFKRRQQLVDTALGVRKRLSVGRAEIGEVGDDVQG